MFFAGRPRRAALSDSNEELVNTYRIVRDQPDELIGALDSLTISRKTFESLRAAIPSHPRDRAVGFLGTRDALDYSDPVGNCLFCYERGCPEFRLPRGGSAWRRLLAQLRRRFEAVLPRPA